MTSSGAGGPVGTPVPDGADSLLTGPVGSPSVVSLEFAWHNLMRTLSHTNAGYAVGANRARKHLHGLMARNGWKGKV